MLYLTQILPALGHAFLHSFWQMGLLLGIYYFITYIVQGTAAFRFKLASLLSLIGSLSFIITFLITLQAPDYGSVYAGEHLLSWYHHAMLSVGVAYIIMLAWEFAQLLVQYKNLQQLHQLPFTKAPIHLRLFVEQHAAYLSIKRAVKLRLQPIISPATFGWLKPIILLPASCLTQLSIAQTEALLLHELAHIKRNDFAWNLLLQLSETLLCINPFMKNLTQLARQESEHACDDMVLQFGYEPNDYAKALLIIAKNQTAPAWALCAKGQKGGEHLVNRIYRILSNTNQTSKETKIRSLRLLIVAVCAGWFFPSTIHSFNERKKNNVVESENVKVVTAMNTLNTPWKVTLHTARTNILAAAIGRKTLIKENKIIANNNQLVAKTEKTIKGNKQEPLIKNTTVNTDISASEIDVTPTFIAVEQNVPIQQENSNPLILNAGLVNNLQQNSIALDEGVTKGLQEISILLEKLELEKDLMDAEWQKLIALISFHSSLKKELYNQAYLQQNPQIAAFNAYEVPADEEGILVIVYDEATSVLGTTVMQPHELPEHIQLNENITTNEQQVIFLKRKQVQKGKIIQL